MNSRPLALALAVLLSFSFGCGTRATEPPQSATAADADKKESSARRSGPRRSTVIGNIPEGTFGPRLFADSEVRLAVWAAPGESGGWFALPLPYRGTPGAEQQVLENESRVEFFELGRFGKDGVLVSAVRKSGERWVIEAFELSRKGELRRGPEVVAETPSEILWVASQPSSAGARVFWAERGEKGADIYALSVSFSSDTGSPVSVVKEAVAWQLAHGAGGTALATTEGDSSGADVVVRLLSDGGEAPPKKRVVAEDVRGALDLDLAAQGGEFVVGFSREDRQHGRLVSARIDPKADGQPRTAFLTPPRGDQVLVQLLSGRVSGGSREDEVVFIWEEPTLAPTETRELLIASAPGGRTLRLPGAVLEIEQSDELLPLFSLSDEGLMAVSRADFCPVSEETCSSRNPVPLAIQAQPDFSAQAEPLVLSQLSNQPAAMVWDLTCNARGCFSLASDGGRPPKVFLMDVASPAGAQPPLEAIAAQPLPHVSRREVLGEVKELSDMVGVPSSDGVLLAWLSFFDPSTPYERRHSPAPDGRMAPERAHLVTQWIAEQADGSTQSVNDTVISYRARSLGGVALSRAHQEHRLLGWAAMDGKEPQLFATVVDQRGEKVRQQMLTRSGGEVTDVVVARVPEGYVIAWADGRHTQAEVYAARLNDNLRLVGKEQRITRGAKAPTGLALATFGDELLLVWADARGAEQRGYADLFGVRLDAATAKNQNSPRRLSATEDHSHSPRFAPLGPSRWALAWLEANPGPNAGGRSSVMLTEVDVDGRFGAPARAVDVEGDARAFALSCSEGSCRLAVSVDLDRSGQLWAGLWSGTEPVDLRPVTLLTGPPLESSPPVLVGTKLFYVDRDRGGRHLLHALTLSWSDSTTNDSPTGERSKGRSEGDAQAPAP